MTLMEQVKILLGIAGTDKDTLLSLLCDNVTAQVKTYCRLSNVANTGLQGNMAEMVVTRFRARGYGQDATPKTVSKLTEGDVSLTFDVTQYNATGELTDTEKKELSQYRRMWS